MSRNLPAIFRAMRKLGAPVNHYKVCSTFDSAPQVGNIGRAMEIGRAAWGNGVVPIVVGAPRLGRAVIFGNLFAEAEGTFYRIDRHPTMRRHPITPMAEADLRLHLAKQTSLRIGLIDLAAFRANTLEERMQSELAAGAHALLFDGFSDAMLHQTGCLIWNRAILRPIFAVGSSGLTSGLLHHWRSIGLIPGAKKPRRAKPADRLLVLSGSCSPATAKQIRRAQQSGFTTLRLQGFLPWTTQQEKALEALKSGRSVVIYTALGPQPKDPKHGERFGAALGTMLRRLVAESGVSRILKLAGGDTSTHAVKQLGLGALTLRCAACPRCAALPWPRIRLNTRWFGTRAQGWPDGPRGLLRSGTRWDIERRGTAILMLHRRRIACSQCE